MGTAATQEASRGGRFGLDTAVLPVLALLAVYLLWGTSFLAMRLAVKEVAPLLMSGIRFMAVAAILVALALLIEGIPHLRRAQFLHYCGLGVLLFLGSSGLLAYGVQHVPAGISSVLIATIPLWLVVIEIGRGRMTLRPSIALGMAGGIGGVALIVHPDSGQAIDLMACGAILLSAAAWAFGSLSTPAGKPQAGPLTVAAIEAAAGSLALLAVAGLTGELAAFSPGSVSTTAWLAVAWLVVPVGVITFGSYTFALRVWPPHVVAAYPFVNSVVAVGLGWLLLSETVTVVEIVGCAIVLGSAALIAARDPVVRDLAESSDPVPPESRGALS